MSSQRLRAKTSCPKSNGDWVTRFTVPPMPWASMSGVTTLTTSRRESSWPPTTSSGTRGSDARPSGLHSWTPFCVTFDSDESMPLIET